MTAVVPTLSSLEFRIGFDSRGQTIWNLVALVIGLAAVVTWGRWQRRHADEPSEVYAEGCLTFVLVFATLVWNGSLLPIGPLAWLIASSGVLHRRSRETISGS